MKSPAVLPLDCGTGTMTFEEEMRKEQGVK